MNAEQAAAALWDARRARRVVLPLPASIAPRDEQEGAAVQLALARLSAEGIVNLSTLQRLYRAEFNRRLDLEQVVASYVYGRQVLAEALACGTPALLAAVTRFLGELEGRAHGDQLIF